MKFLMSFMISIASLSAYAENVQTCTRVDEADDWTLTFDFAKKEVVFFDNDRDVAGTYQYTIETVQGIDVFNSNNKNDPWTAKFYGNRTTNGNKAELVLGDRVIEFICEIEQVL